jgi:hypothetical protein
MKKNLILAAVTTLAIAASSIVATTGAFAAVAAPAPHYKPLMCIFFPTMDVCNPPKPVVHHHHHMAMKKPMKPAKPK